MNVGVTACWLGGFYIGVVSINALVNCTCVLANVK